MPFISFKNWLQFMALLKLTGINEIYTPRLSILVEPSSTYRKSRTAWINHDDVRLIEDDLAVTFS